MRGSSWSGGGRSCSERGKTCCPKTDSAGTRVSKNNKKIIIIVPNPHYDRNCWVSLLSSVARDSWKKKYFEAKKVTAALEERLKNSQQELEATYNKLLHQLQARDNRAKPKRQGRSSLKVSHTVTALH